MDMGIQNLPVDDELGIIAAIARELAQSAPWEIFHYPMTSPLVISNEEIASRY